MSGRRMFHLVYLMAIMFVGSVAVAQNPNPEIPDAKSICEEMKHGTPGLYGLCLAFWSGQDCTPDFTAEDPFEECTPASSSILEKYRAQAQPGDPDMPCIQNPCPCWSEEELDLLWPAGGTSQDCFLDYPNDVFR